MFHTHRVPVLLVCRTDTQPHYHIVTVRNTDGLLALLVAVAAAAASGRWQRADIHRSRNHHADHDGRTDFVSCTTQP